MRLSEYQSRAKQTALGLAKGEGGSPLNGLVYCGLGLNGEAGEVAEQIKKAWRNDGELTPERKNKVAGELGDVLWYTAMAAEAAGLDLHFIAEANLKKLASRKARAVLASEGDER